MTFDYKQLWPVSSYLIQRNNPVVSTDTWCSYVVLPQPRPVNGMFENLNKMFADEGLKGWRETPFGLPMAVNASGEAMTAAIKKHMQEYAK